MAKQKQHRQSTRPAQQARPTQPGRPRQQVRPRGGAPVDAADAKAQVAKTARLWVLSLICACAGAYTIYRTNSLPLGIGVFALVLIVLGSLLFVYEKVHAKRRLR